MRESQLRTILMVLGVLAGTRAAGVGTVDAFDSIKRPGEMTAGSFPPSVALGWGAPPAAFGGSALFPQWPGTQLRPPFPAGPEPAQPEVWDAPFGLRLGTSVAGMHVLLSLGHRPDFAQVWAGAWNERGWGGVQAGIRDALAQRVTPIVQWYYWGDDISPGALANGVVGSGGVVKDTARWFELAAQLAALIHDTAQGRTVLVVLETEFNKNGIGSDPSFDALLAQQAAILRAGAPEAVLVLGFGNWNLAGWDRFPLTGNAVDMMGFQTMRAATRPTAGDYAGVPAAALAAAQRAHDLFGKPILLTDLALSSWGGHEADQDAALRGLLAEAPALAALGLVGIVYRDWLDHPVGSGRYFGPAEDAWGLATQDGVPKPAGEAWLSAMAVRIVA